MAWTAPSDPVTNTIITVAYAVANLLTQIRHLRVMTGNADPPGSFYSLISSSVSAVSWSKIPADALAANAVTTHLGYTPINKAGDSGIGALTSTGTITAERLVAGATGVSSGGPISATGGVAAGGSLSATGVTCTTITPSTSYNGGSASAGAMAVGGLSVGNSGLGVAGTGGINVTGGGAIQGGSTTAGGDLNVIGANVGAHGLAVAGAGGLALSGGGGISIGGVTVLDSLRNLTALTYNGGSTLAGNPSMLGANVGNLGMGIAGQINSTVLHPTPPMLTLSQGKVVNFHADVLDGAHASSAPAGLSIPIADATGKLDPGWIPAGGGSGTLIPAGMGFWWSGLAASIPTGWTRATGLDGRVPVGAGTTFSQTFVEGASYGAAWTHSHASGGVHNHSGASLSVSGTTGTPSASGGTTSAGSGFATGTHTHDQGTLDVGGNTDSNTTVATSADAWVIPMFGVIWVTKT